MSGIVPGASAALSQIIRNWRTVRSSSCVRLLEQRARLLDDPRAADERRLRLFRADALAGVFVA